MDSTKPASHSSRRCFDTVGCGIRSWRSISPTDCWAETRRLNIARRFGSAMISNTDSTLLYILHGAYTRQGILRGTWSLRAGTSQAWHCSKFINHKGHEVTRRMKSQGFLRAFVVNFRGPLRQAGRAGKTPGTPCL